MPLITEKEVKTGETLYVRSSKYVDTCVVIEPGPVTNADRIGRICRSRLYGPTQEYGKQPRLFVNLKRADQLFRPVGAQTIVDNVVRRSVRELAETRLCADLAVPLLEFLGLAP